MRLYKREDVYYLDYTDSQGKCHRESTGTGNRKLAEEISSKRHTELVEGKFDIKKPEKITFEEFSIRFIEYCNTTKRRNTAITHGYNLIPLKESFKALLLSDITPLHIEEFIMRRVQKVSPSTVNRELTTMNHLFNLAIKWNMALKNPLLTVNRLKEPPGRIRYLSIYEISALLRECNKPYLFLAVVMALNTGMRKGEILALKREDVDLDNRIVSVKESKSGKRRDIPVNDNLFPVLEEWIENLQGERLISVDDFKKSFHGTLERAGINDFTFHDLRHTFASHLVMEGIDLATVKELMGHATIQMTMRYAHLSPDHRNSAVNRLVNRFQMKAG